MKDKNILENINFEEYYKTHSPGYVIEVYKNEIIQEFILGNKLTNPITVETRYDTLYDIASLTKTFTSVLVYMA